jgi:biotin operon repressor
MANKLSVAQVQTIHSLHKSDYSNRQIAETLGIDRGTVNKRVQSLRVAPDKPASWQNRAA